MSDFDFDEIDKAVAGALAPDEPAETPAKEEKFVEKEAPREEVVAVPEKIATEETASSQPAPAARRSAGRFMDVVHPSSDMRSRSSFTPPTNTTVPPVAPAKPVDDDAPKEEVADASWSAPLESPFLPDAKVEKRPLGGEPAPASVQEEELLLEAPDEPLLEATTMPDPIDFVAHANALPFENEDTGSTDYAAVTSIDEAVSVVVEEDALVHDDVTNTDMVGAEKAVEGNTDAELSVEPEEQPKEEVVETAEVLEAPKAEPTPIETVEPVGPTSITQQYTEQPSSEQTSGAIYDTETYHKPVAAEPKKKSGVWIFIWILLLIILGAGAGVAFYLFVLPMLQS